MLVLRPMKLLSLKPCQSKVTQKSIANPDFLRVPVSFANVWPREPLEKISSKKFSKRSLDSAESRRFSRPHIRKAPFNICALLRGTMIVCQNQFKPKKD